MSITERADGVIITIYVKPNSPKFQIERDGDEIVVHCTEEPVKGKVNKEIVKEFTKLFHKKIVLVYGVTSRQKKFLINDAEKGEIERCFNALFPLRDP